MHRIELLIPFCLPSSELAVTLCKQLAMPVLACLMARSSLSEQKWDGLLPTLPHENWLYEQFFPSRFSTRDMVAPAMAMVTMSGLSHAPQVGTWFVLNPIHIHVARDHLVLTDRRHLQLSQTHARALFDAALPYFEEVGKLLVYGNEQTWFVRADEWQDLRTTTPDAACGHNMDRVMPHGASARAWRILQNHINMCWHTHPVNTERASQKKVAVNSLWIWGGAVAPCALAHAMPTLCMVEDGLLEWKYFVDCFTQQGDRIGNVEDLINVSPSSGLTVGMVDRLMMAALSNDWGAWIEHMHQIEKHWLAPLYQALKANRIQQLRLVLSNATTLRTFTVNRFSLRKFWISPSLKKLL